MSSKPTNEFETIATEESEGGILYEYWCFLRYSKKWWLLPLILVLLAVGSLLVFAQGSALAPFIYSIF